MTDNSFSEYLADLRSETPVRKQVPPITYALVAPDGSLEFHTESPEKMREKVGEAGAGLVDRIILNEPRTVHAYLGEMVPAARENANPVANEMLRLLGCYDGPFFGSISFFAVAARGHEPRSLDEEQQEMLCAAHQVAQVRADAASR